MTILKRHTRTASEMGLERTEINLQITAMRHESMSANRMAPEWPAG